MPAALAPGDLKMPDFIRPTLGHRADRVLGHGFSDRDIGCEWWRTALERHDLAPAVRLHQHGDKELLTRGDIFAIGRVATAPDATDDDVLSLLWHALAWGTGSSQRGNARRIESLTGADRAVNVELLRTAAKHAMDGDPASAYSTLICRGGGRIRGLGPAFFTKFLYFASEGTTGTRCLILDARVAGELGLAGWASLPHRGGSYSYNWYTDTYVSYCELLAHWAEEESDRLKTTVWPDEIERALFAGPDQ